MAENEAKSKDAYTILVAEDDEGLSLLIKKRLKRAGFRTEQAFSGAEAISKVLENPNVLLLLDYFLPDMTGRELVKTLARRKRRVPFIVVTGRGDEKTAVEMMKLGAKDYLVKDTDFLELLPPVIRHVLGDLTTERKLAETEAELLGSEERYQHLVETVSQGIEETDVSGTITFANPAHHKILGYTEGELVGKSIFDLRASDSEQKKLSEYLRKLVKEQPAPTPYFQKNRTKAGRVIDVRVEWNYKRDEQGEVTGFISIISDITERKQAEKRQSELINDLARANEELKDFAYIVSHDLKAPLRAISSLAEWIASDYADKLDADGKEQLDLLKNRVQRMHRFIEGILQYSRVGRVKEEKEMVNLTTLVREVIDLIDPPANIKIDVANQLPTIFCEQTKMEQVIQNLLSNAVQNMDKPKGRVIIGCTEEDGQWKFSVADNGPGIAERHYETIFKIFQTLKPRDEVESTGVGLTIVKKIVEAHGGKIWVESKVDEGSTFFFTVPKVTEPV